MHGEFEFMSNQCKKKNYSRISLPSETTPKWKNHPNRLKIFLFQYASFNSVTNWEIVIPEQVVGFWRTWGSINPYELPLNWEKFTPQCIKCYHLIFCYFILIWIGDFCFGKHKYILTHIQKAPRFVRDEETHIQKARRFVRVKGTHVRKTPRSLSVKGNHVQKSLWPHQWELIFRCITVHYFKGGFQHSVTDRDSFPFGYACYKFFLCIFKNIYELNINRSAFSNASPLLGVVLDVFVTYWKLCSFLIFFAIFDRV